MSQPPQPSARLPNVGASCLPAFAEYLAAPEANTLNKEAAANNQYVVVHMYLVPGDAQDERRAALRNEIAAHLSTLNAIRLHMDAFAVPCVRRDEVSTADLAWQHLLYAGAKAAINNRSSAWEPGDVVYVHYASHDGLHAMAATPSGGQPLPHP